MITEVAQPLQAIIDIEKTGLSAHRFISDPIGKMESEMTENGEVFRNVQLDETKALLAELQRRFVQTQIDEKVMHRWFCPDCLKVRTVRET